VQKKPPQWLAHLNARRHQLIRSGLPRRCQTRMATPVKKKVASKVVTLEAGDDPLGGGLPPGEAAAPAAPAGRERAVAFGSAPTAPPPPPPQSAALPSFLPPQPMAVVAGSPAATLVDATPVRASVHLSFIPCACHAHIGILSFQDSKPAVTPATPVAGAAAAAVAVAPVDAAAAQIWKAYTIDECYSRGSLLNENVIMRIEYSSFINLLTGTTTQVLR
jgi:hypothetical protein